MNPWAWVIPLALGVALAIVAAWFGVRGINILLGKSKKTVKTRRKRTVKPKPKE